MKKKDKQIIFLLTKEQWLGVAILISLVLTTMAILHFFPRPEDTPSNTTIVTDSIRLNFAAYQDQQDSIRKAEWKKKYPRDTVDTRSNAATAASIPLCRFSGFDAAKIPMTSPACGVDALPAPA